VVPEKGEILSLGLILAVNLLCKLLGLIASITAYSSSLNPCKTSATSNEI
jgi:hypothetical protein